MNDPSKGGRSVSTLDYKYSRRAMLQDLLKVQGIQDKKVLKAMGRVKRHLFVDEALHGQAYSENALPIGYGQTISQPYTVAKMTSALQVEPGMKVLEIGTGCGYQAAILAEMGAEVFSVERIKGLYFAALTRLNRLRYFNIKLKLDDGTLGWQEYEPYDRIIVTAMDDKIPAKLLQQLTGHGILLIPLKTEQGKQKLFRIRQNQGKWYKQDLGPVNFVSLIYD